MGPKQHRASALAAGRGWTRQRSSPMTHRHVARRPARQQSTQTRGDSGMREPAAQHAMSLWAPVAARPALTLLPRGERTRERGCGTGGVEAWSFDDDEGNLRRDDRRFQLPASAAEISPEPETPILGLRTYRS
ncbi:hypothetical protein GUJ93_ZPchr0002g25419 [Zizania palustris]|uniref:Uncharacterized protein n=1 Tax=Zizania palustris TaxID=103762 RepID=A0A8J5RT01_ZIZPA|nr:hypothetical protein GUJ93_ZPchr0002g25419 [Zizania palustris]